MASVTSRKAPLCHLCGNKMLKHPRVDKNAHARDAGGKIIQIVRHYWYCPKDNTILSVWFRKDGKKGDLRFQLDLQKDGYLPSTQGLNFLDKK